MTKQEWNILKKSSNVLVYYDEPQVFTLNGNIIAILVDDNKYLVSINNNSIDIEKFKNGEIDLRSLFIPKLNRTFILVTDCPEYNCENLTEIDETYLPKSGFYL